MDCCIKPIFSLISKTPPPPPPSNPSPPFIITPHWAPSLSSRPSSPFPHKAVPPNLSLPHQAHEEAQDQHLLSLLRDRRTEEAWVAYTESTHLPNSVCLSRLLCQLSYQNTPLSLSRARSILARLRQLRQLHRLDNNSLGLLAVAASKSGSTPYAASIIRSMLRSGYLPHVKAWSAVVSRLAASPDDGPLDALRLFDAVVRRVRAAKDNQDSRPDTAAFNGALNACANIGDVDRFCQLFEGMPEFDARPDVLTYNVMIKLCARVERKDLLGFILERIIDDGLVPCITTLTSLVAAYVGFGDLETAENMVQAMREGRLDLCNILRNSKNSPRTAEIPEGDLAEQKDAERPNQAESVFRRLLPKAAMADRADPPLLPKAYYPDSRMYTTLMKGYLKDGRVTDVVRMLEAMRQQSDSKSHPDHVTYTTVISALVNAGSMERARQVLADMERVGVPANRITYNILLKGYCQQLQVNKARELLQDMVEEAGIEPDVVSYNIIIDGYVLVDNSAAALSYFNEMRSRGIAPTKISYTTLVKAFALAGQPKLAHKVFDEMLKDPRVKVDLIAWNMLIEGYCRLGFVEEAKKLVERMKEEGFYPDIATYGSLANGIALARKPGEALLLWNEIKERCKGRGVDGRKAPVIRPDEGLLVTLAEVCVRAAFFQKALEIVACMEENGISPNKTKYKKIYIEMHSRMFTSKHASQARQDRRRERKRAAEAFKFWLGLPNAYYGSEWRLEPLDGDGVEYPSI